MLDYRAHNLFLLLFWLPLVIINLSVMLLYPLSLYVISAQLADATWARLIIILCLIVPAEILILMLLFSIDWIFYSIFEFIVDVEPSDDRNEDEAKAVVIGGKKAIVSQQLSKLDHEPDSWDSAYDEMLISITNLPTRLFFAQRIRDRLAAYRDYRANPEVESPHSLEIFLEETGRQPTFGEKFLGNPGIYKPTVTYTLLLTILVVNPFSL